MDKEPEIEQPEMLHQKVRFWIILCIVIAFIFIIIYFVGNYIDNSYSLNFNITEEYCYNFTYLDDNFTRCKTIESPELRKEIGDCNKYRNMSCVVEKDCGMINDTYFNYSNCKYYAYESIKKEDINLEFLEDNCECQEMQYDCDFFTDLNRETWMCESKDGEISIPETTCLSRYKCFERYIVEILR